MKTLIGIIATLAIGIALTGCNHHKPKGHGKYNKGKHQQHLPGDRGKQAPNCAADGPGCRQFNPNK